MKRKIEIMKKSIKKPYESPTIERTQIETEGTFASSIDKKELNVKAESQDYEEFGADAWDKENNDALIDWGE